MSYDYGDAVDSQDGSQDDVDGHDDEYESMSMMMRRRRMSQL